VGAAGQRGFPVGGFGCVDFMLPCARAMTSAHPSIDARPLARSRTDGVDIDPVLVGKAVANVARLREGLQGKMMDATSPAKRCVCV